MVSNDTHPFNRHVRVSLLAIHVAAHEYVVLHNIVEIAGDHGILDSAHDFTMPDTVAQTKVAREIAVDNIALTKTDEVLDVQAIINLRQEFSTPAFTWRNPRGMRAAAIVASWSSPGEARRIKIV